MRFEPNPRFEQEIERQVEYRAGLIRDGEVVLQEAKAIAPFRPHRGEHYRDTLKVKIVGPSVYVTTTDFAGHLVEWGSINNPPYAVIRRAVKQTGLRLDEAQRNRIGQPGFSAVIPNVL